MLWKSGWRTGPGVCRLGHGAEEGGDDEGPAGPLNREAESKSVQKCNLWTVAHHAPPSMGFCRHSITGVVATPSSGDLPGPGIEPASLMPPALAGGFFTTWAARRPFPLFTFPYLLAESAFFFFLKLWAWPMGEHSNIYSINERMRKSQT